MTIQQDSNALIRIIQIDQQLRRGVELHPEDKAWYFEQEALQRNMPVYGTFYDFVAGINPTLLRYEHVPPLVEIGQRIIDGELLRVLILLPPRYFKTEIFGRLLPAYYLLKFMMRTCAVASYAADKAWETSEEARDYYQQAHGVLKQETTAKKRWRTARGGALWATGMGAGFLGRGYHLGVVDDPVDPEQARSPTYIRRFQRWWPGKWLSRQEPIEDYGRAAIVMVMQRLGIDDPIDYLFRREIGEGIEEAPEFWHVVAMDEIKSHEKLGRWKGPRGLPETCTLELDKRKRGQVLAPARFTLVQAKAMQKSAGPYIAATQRQQRPARPTGDFWKERWFRDVTPVPTNAYNRGRDWDTAMTRREKNSATAWVESSRGPGDVESFPIYIHDCGWEWYEFPAMIKWMKSLKGAPHYVEAKASGKPAVQVLKANGIVAHEVGVVGDKLARASAVQAAVSNGRVYVAAHVKQTLLWGEMQGLLRVTAEDLEADGEGLDLNDAFVQALHRHLEIHTAKKKRALFK